MIQAIFFDMYGTLANWYPPREELQAAACREFGLEVTRRGIAKGYALADEFMAQQNARRPLRQMSEEERSAFFAEYERLILRGAGHEVSVELSGRIFAQVRRTPYDLALYDDVLPALHLLREQGYTLGLISNINRGGEQLLAQLGLTAYLDFVVTSHEVGAEKPHPPIFLAALEKAGVEPGEAIHVGDQVQSDVEGARRVGIYPVLLDRDDLKGDYAGCPRIRSLMEMVDIIAHLMEEGPLVGE